MNRIIFLDIDGPMIPSAMYLIDRMCSYNRILSPLSVATIKELCHRSGAKVVFNTTHNASWDDVPDIDVAMINHGFPADYIHPDMKTRYPELRRDDAVYEWLSRHPKTEDWIAFDDTKFIEKDNLILVDMDEGLHPRHMNIALERWNLRQFWVL